MSPLSYTEPESTELVTPSVARLELDAQPFPWLTLASQACDYALASPLPVALAKHSTDEYAPWEKRLIVLKSQSGEAFTVLPALIICIALIAAFLLAPVSLSWVLALDVDYPEHRVLSVFGSFGLIAVALGLPLLLILRAIRESYNGGYRRTWRYLNSTSLPILIADSDSYYHAREAERVGTACPLQHQALGERLEDHIKSAVVNMNYLLSFHQAHTTPTKIVTGFSDLLRTGSRERDGSSCWALGVTVCISVLGPLGCLAGLAAMACDRTTRPANLGALSAVCDFFLAQPNHKILQRSRV